MQLKIFTVPVFGGEEKLEELNKFLRGNKILSVTETTVDVLGTHWWSYSVRYLDGKSSTERKQPKVDYRKVLDETAFNYFTRLRSLRKELSQKEGVPAYVIFRDVELAEIAKLGGKITMESLRSLKDVGEQKVVKYGPEIMKMISSETSE